jgi:heme exporter protein C
MHGVTRAGKLGIGLSFVGVTGVIFTHWMVFFWVPTEATMGIVQRANYVHVPMAWITLLAFALAAFASAIYLWLEDDRADAMALSAAEGGLYTCAGLIVAGSLWGRVAWGTFWTWEPRLSLTLLMLFIFLGYVMVRRVAESPERAKRIAAVVAIVGALLIPLIHLSVYMFRSMHPEPVYLRPDGPSADFEFSLTTAVAFLAYTLLFSGLLMLRYGVEKAEREWDRLVIQSERTP